MPETDARDIVPKLGQKSDWRDWYRAVKREADRLGLVQYLDNVVDNGVAPGLPVQNNGESRAVLQKWRNLKDSILKSLKTSAESYMKNRDSTAMNAGEVVVDLRDNGRFAVNNRQEQRMNKKVLLGMKFHDRTAPQDPVTFLSEIRDKMNLMPDLYPPEAGAAAGQEQNKAILDALPDMFSKSFKETIVRMQEDRNITFEEICDRLEVTLARLTEEGTYKVENPSFGKAFPATADEKDEDQEVEGGNCRLTPNKKNKKSNNNKRNRSTSDDEEDVNSGGIFTSVKAQENWKKRQLKKLKAQVMNTNGNNNQGNNNNRNRSRNNGGKGGGKNRNSVTCNWCNKPGHKQHECRSKKAYDQSVLNRANQNYNNNYNNNGGGNNGWNNNWNSWGNGQGNGKGGNNNNGS